MAEPQPTIRGIFVKSHVKALRLQRGDRAVHELERRFGRPVNFKNLDEVLVADESRLIELIVDILGDPPPSESQRAFEAGRLHFRNFKTTPLGRILFSVFPDDFKAILKRSSHVAEHIFRGMKFTTLDAGPEALTIRIENNGYPLDHFRGIFDEWLKTLNCLGQIECREPRPGLCTYEIKWNAKNQNPAAERRAA